MIFKLKVILKAALNSKSPALTRSLMCLILTGLLASCGSGSKKNQNSGGAPVVNAALNEQNVPLKIAFGSCAQPRTAQPIWKKILEQKPEAYLALGDNTYTNDKDENYLDTAYKLQWQVPEWVEVIKTVPVFATWDDNDYGLNDGGKNFALKKDSHDTFLKYFNWLKPKMASEDGIYYSVSLGTPEQTLHFIFLDTRSFRDDLEINDKPKSPLDKYKPTKDIKKTLLGEEQWKWLEAEMAKPASIRVIVSSIQFLATEQGFEKWANFPHERNRLIQLINKTSQPSVFILSGDRHFSEIAELKTKSKTISEITASAINRISTIENEPNRFRLGKLYNKENFGMMEIDWNERQVGFRIHDIHGNTINQASYKF